MPVIDFIPKRDGDLATWLYTFNQTVQTTGSAVGLSPEELAAIQADTDALREQIAAVFTAKAALKAATTSKNAATKRVIKALRRHCARIKTHTAYTPAIGKSYGIVARHTRWDAENARPALKLAPMPGKVVVHYKKEGSHAVQIWCRRGAETAYTLLAQDMRPPYTDTRPNAAGGPEERTYYAVFVDAADVVVGQRSHLATIVV